MATNLGLEFNKKVYKNLKSNPKQNADYRKDNMALYELLINTKLIDLHPEQLDLKDKNIPNYHAFTLTTSGQGLLLGIGNEHGTGAEYKVNNKKKETHEFKMGFQFDHSTGIPVITGHTLKGRLRSFFPIAYKNKKKKEAILNRLIADIKDCLSKDFNENLINTLQNALFEGKLENGENIKPLKRDDFLGAFPVESKHKSFSYLVPKESFDRNNKPVYNREKNKIVITEGTFLFDDTLAYHKYPLQDPNPIRFLKILPDVEIKFQFKLFDSGGLNADEKEKLFKYLLQKYGIGAKTASGYGQFKKNDNVSTEKQTGFVEFDDFNPIDLDDTNDSHLDIEEKHELKKKESISVKQTNDWAELNSLKYGSRIKGTVIDYKNGNAKVRLHIKDEEIVLNLQGKFTPNQVLPLMVKETLGSIKKGNYTISKVLALKK